MMRRVMTLLLVLLLVACGQQGPAAAPTSAPAPDASAAPDAPAAGDDLVVDPARLSQELYFFSWTDYIDPTILEDFEAEYGVRVIMDLFDANETMIPKIRAGNSGYDVVVPSDYAVQSMVAEGLLAPLDKNLLPNVTHLNEDNLDLYFDPGNQYSLPYFWGVTGIAYNKTAFPTAPDSYAALFDPAQLAAINGKFTMLDDARETPGAALIFSGKSVNDQSPEAIAQAEQLLTQQKPFLAAYDSANVNLKLATEEITIAHAWSGAAAQALIGIEDKPGNSNIAFTIPKEGGVIWMDNLAVVHDSPNQYTAHVFINYLLRPEIAARNADYVLYITPNASAEELLDQGTLDVYNAGFRPDAATLERLQWIERSGNADVVFSELWTRVLNN